MHVCRRTRRYPHAPDVAKGLLDVYGQLDPNYVQQSAPHMRTIGNMVKRVLPKATSPASMPMSASAPVSASADANANTNADVGGRRSFTGATNVMPCGSDMVADVNCQGSDISSSPHNATPSTPAECCAACRAWSVPRTPLFKPWLGACAVSTLRMVAHVSLSPCLPAVLSFSAQNFPPMAPRACCLARHLIGQLATTVWGQQAKANRVHVRLTAWVVGRGVVRVCAVCRPGCKAWSVNGKSEQGQEGRCYLKHDCNGVEAKPDGYAGVMQGKVPTPASANIVRMPRLNIDKSHVITAGCSNTADFSTQFHVAFSAIVTGSSVHHPPHPPLLLRPPSLHGVLLCTLPHGHLQQCLACA